MFEFIKDKMVKRHKSLPTSSPTSIAPGSGQSFSEANLLLLGLKNLSEAFGFILSQVTSQRDSTNEVVSAMHELSASVEDIAKNAEDSSHGFDKVISMSEHGVRHIKAVKVGTAQVADLFSKIALAIEGLKKSSEAIDSVVTVINDLTVQTKLLSFNASVEAARAGEHGRGFAVVAKEVHSLAESTAKSTQEIVKAIQANKSLTQQLAGEIEHAGAAIVSADQGAGEAEETFSRIQVELAELGRRIHQIANAVKEQSGAVSVLSESSNNIAAMADATTNRAQASISRIDQLTSISSDLEKRLYVKGLPLFGLVPAEDPLKMSESFTPIAQVLSQLLGVEFFLKLGHDYNGAIQDLGSGVTLLSYQTPSTYVEAREKYGVIPLVVPLQNGEATYKSAVVVRADSEIKVLSDIAGRKFAFGDPKSISNKAMPEAMLNGAGVSLGRLGKYGFVGNNDNVAKAVLQEIYDAGGMMLSVAEKYESQGLKILSISESIPQFPICASPQLPEELRAKITQALVNLKDPKVLKALGANITGFREVRDSYYNGVREMLRRLNGK